MKHQVGVASEQNKDNLCLVLQDEGYYVCPSPIQSLPSSPHNGKEIYIICIPPILISRRSPLDIKRGSQPCHIIEEHMAIESTPLATMAIMSWAVEVLCVLSKGPYPLWPSTQLTATARGGVCISCQMPQGSSNEEGSETRIDAVDGCYEDLRLHRVKYVTHLPTINHTSKHSPPRRSYSRNNCNKWRPSLSLLIHTDSNLLTQQDGSPWQ